MKRKIMILCGILVIVGIVVLVKLLAISPTVDEACDWCGKSPSVAYKMSDGSKSYVCKDCSRECAWCGEKAMRHYENNLGMMVFVCDDCYEDSDSE